MSKFIDITGKRFNKLTVLSLYKKENGIPVWKCKCDCGNITYVRGKNLKSGAVKSCGCMLYATKNKTHGESKTHLYQQWYKMKYRCENPHDRAYKWYGARGIRVCNDWQTFEGFKKWVELTRPNPAYTIERKNVDGNYCPENCIWIPLSEQANNRTTAVIITYNNETMSLTDWCKKLNVRYRLVHNRMYKLGWDFEKAINTPVDIKKRNKGT